MWHTETQTDARVLYIRIGTHSPPWLRMHKNLKKITPCPTYIIKARHACRVYFGIYQAAQRLAMGGRGQGYKWKDVKILTSHRKQVRKNFEMPVFINFSLNTGSIFSTTATAWETSYPSVFFRPKLWPDSGKLVTCLQIGWKITLTMRNVMI